MTLTPTRIRPSNVSSALARNRLGVPSVIFFVLSAAAPLTVVAGLVTTGYAVTGITGIPLAFLVIALLLGLFSVGFVAMARRVANAGAFYAYIARGLGRPFGVGAAWIALIAYNLLQVGLYGAVGAAAAPVIEQWLGVGTQWWVVALVSWAIVGGLGVLRVDINGKVLAVLLLAEVAIIVVFDAANLLSPAGGQVTFDTLAPGNLLVPGVGAILVLAATGFTGFESSVVFSEESKDAKRTVPMATYLSVAIIGGLYALSAWAMTVATGPGSIVERAQGEDVGLIFNLAGERLGNSAVHIGQALFLTSLLAAMISFHNTTARYTFALGRERVLPSVFGQTSPRSGAPVAGSMAQTVLGLLVILIYAIAGWDPLVQLFFWGGTLGGFGVLLLITATSVAVVAYFVRQPSGESIWHRIIAPGLAAVALAVIVLIALANFANLLGVEPDSPLRWLLPTVYLFAAILGTGWGIVLRSTRPDVYATIGLGAERATALISAPRDGADPTGDQPTPTEQSTTTGAQR